MITANDESPLSFTTTRVAGSSPVSCNNKNKIKTTDDDDDDNDD